MDLEREMLRLDSALSERARRRFFATGDLETDFSFCDLDRERRERDRAV